jgi:hypothetical protein
MKRVSVRSLELVGSPKKGTKNIMLMYHKKTLSMVFKLAQAKRIYLIVKKLGNNGKC